MKGFKRTSSFGVGRGAHSHIIYVNDEKGSALSSSDANHTHQVVYQPPTPEVPPGVDPMTGQPTPGQPATPGGYIVQPAEDGHTHELEDLIVKKPKKKQSDEDIVKENYALFRSAKDYEHDNRKKARESDDFYCGDQWPADVKADLEKCNRAALTINLIGKSIDEISGHQRQQRTDVKYVPPEMGDQRVADLLTHVAKHIFEKCFYFREESKAFEDETIVGRGNLVLAMDYASSLRGDLKISRYPWDDILYGPHEFEDLSDLEHLHKHKMYSKAKIEQLWPDKAKEVGDYYESLCDWNEGEKPTIDHQGDEYAATNDSRAPVPIIGEMSMYDIARKEFRVIETQKKIYSQVTVFVFPQDDFYYNSEGWTPKEIASAKTIEGIRAISKHVSKVRVSTVCGSVLLEDRDSDIDDFDVVPIYAKKRGNKWWGKVEAVKDPQREINKRHSQAVDIGNKVCAYGFGYDENTFDDQAEAERFKRNVATPGFVTKLADVARPPHMFEGVKFPNEIVQLMALGADQIKGLMNIQPDEGGANTSGFALMQRMKAKLVGNDFLFDNLSFAKKRIGKLVVKYIQKFYDAERIYRIVQNRTKKHEIQIGGQAFEKYPEAEIVELLEREDLADYDVEVSESSYSPSMQLATAAVLSELAKTGFPVPPQMLIEMMDLPEDSKKKFMDGMAQQQQGSAEAEKAKVDSEMIKPMMKPLLEAGIIPPMVRDLLNGGQQQPQNGQPPQQPPPQQ